MPHNAFNQLVVLLRRDYLRLQDGSARSAFWIAADAAYDSSTCKGIITPWSKGQLSDPELGLWRDSFNFYHSSLRIHIEQSFGMLVARFGLLWRQMRCHITGVSKIVSACMRLQNYCIDKGAPPLRAAMMAEEQVESDLAFRRWWAVVTALRGETGGCQGRRSDLSISYMRDEMTKLLATKSITRPR
jgi:DDE superfamily endonuclease